MRIAITHPYSWPEVRRGAERIVVETARSLSERGHDVTLITAGAVSARTRQDGYQTIRLRRIFSSNPRHERFFALQILPLLVRGRYEIVHAMMAWDGYSAVIARRWGGHRVVFDDMGIPYAFWADLPDGRARKLLVRRADVYGCMSQFALDVLRKDWGREGALIPGGVRVEQFPVALEREPVPTVLFSGAMSEERKGLPLLLEAVALLAGTVPDLQVWLSGPGDPSAFLARAPEKARQVAKVLPIGEPQGQSERYRRAWTTALPAKSEAFGLVLVESLASGTPIVVVDDATPPSLVTPATGAIAEPDNPESLADAIKRGLDLARNPHTATSCRNFARQFDWDEAIAPLLEEIYEGVLR